MARVGLKGKQMDNERKLRREAGQIVIDTLREIGIDPRKASTHDFRALLPKHSDYEPVASSGCNYPTDLP